MLLSAIYSMAACGGTRDREPPQRQTPPHGIATGSLTKAILAG